MMEKNLKVLTNLSVARTYFNYFIYVEFLTSAISVGASKSNGDRVSKIKMKPK